MSTKIYNAYKFAGTIQELHAVLVEMRKKYHERVIEILSSVPLDTPAAALFFNQPKLIDKCQRDHLLPDEELKNKTFGELNMFSLDSVLTTAVESERSLPINFEASAVVYLHEDMILVQFFGIEKLSETLSPAFTDFHYQNQVDQPDNVSDEEWEYRERVWDSVFNGITAFADAGFVYDIYAKRHCFEIAREVIDRRKK